MKNMSEIALYNTLRKIPGISDDEAKEAIADIASSKDVATKAEVERMGRVLTMWMVGVGFSLIGIIIAVLK